ncbi:helix-turn-helix transcriptional regulator [Mesorhizobium sp. B2-7-3]|nr:helix-turn-helix transcriptional regulator [Mesorhizobium sp. B2-7-3]
MVLTSFRPLQEINRTARAGSKDAGITQGELGKRLGQRQTFVSKFELGERRLDVAEFVTVARAIGIDPLRII